MVVEKPASDTCPFSRKGASLAIEGVSSLYSLRDVVVYDSCIGEEGLCEVSSTFERSCNRPNNIRLWYLGAKASCQQAKVLF